MDWPWSPLKKKMVETTKAINEAAGPADAAPANEKQYQDELKALRLRMGYGTITKEQYDQQSQDLNKRYGR